MVSTFSPKRSSVPSYSGRLESFGFLFVSVFFGFSVSLFSSSGFFGFLRAGVLSGGRAFFFYSPIPLLFLCFRFSFPMSLSVEMLRTWHSIFSLVASFQFSIPSDSILIASPYSDVSNSYSTNLRGVDKQHKSNGCQQFFYSQSVAFTSRVPSNV